MSQLVTERPYSGSQIGGYIVGLTLEFLLLSQEVGVAAHRIGGPGVIRTNRPGR
jgi:hypothetical protein